MGTQSTDPARVPAAYVAVHGRGPARRRTVLQQSPRLDDVERDGGPK